MSALRTFLCAICHPTDKGLGPYVAYRPNYMRQGIKEHLSNPVNYTRLSVNKATAKLAKQKKLFCKAFAEYKDWLTEDQVKYFKRSFKKHSCFGGSRNPLLYLLWKVHKITKVFLNALSHVIRSVRNVRTEALVGGVTDGTRESAKSRHCFSK